MKSSFRWRSVALSLVAILAFVLIAAWIRNARDQARSNICTNNLKQIGLALLNYRQLHGTFPPAFLSDASGKPVNSWRAEVVPSFWYNFRPGRDDYAGGPGYDYAEPWNGPKNANLKLDKAVCVEFQCPCETSNKPAVTSYVAVVGPNTMWRGTKSATPASDGSDDDKILVIEIINSDILWMEPRDLTLEQALDTIQPENGIGVGSHHRNGMHYLTVGGKVKTLPPNIDRDSLRKLLVRDPANVPAE